MPAQRAVRRPDSEHFGPADGPTPIGVLLVDVVARLRATAVESPQVPLVMAEADSVAALAGSC